MSYPDPTTPGPLVLGVDLTSAGARPGAHRARGIVPPRSFDAERFVQLVRTADAGGLDLVTLDEGFLLHPGRRQVTGRLDAAVAAARVAPHTRRTGLVAAVDTTHVAPEHVARAIARVDQASEGRAGWQVGLPTGAVVQDDAWAARARAGADQVAKHWGGHGRGSAPGGVPVDADGRFRVDHDGIQFAVRHQERDVRPRRGRPLVVVSVRSEAAIDLAARTADVARVAVTALDRAVRLRSRLHAAAAAAGREPDSLRVLAETYVVLAEDRASAQARLELVEALEGPEVSGNRLVVAGTPDDLAATIVHWREAGAADGFLLRPSSLVVDLDAVVDDLVPRLERDGVMAPAVAGQRTFRETLGLRDPYVAASDPDSGQSRRLRAHASGPTGAPPVGSDARLVRA